jgi:RNA polymerase sigma-70 factor (ECF subfamily)
VHAIARYKLVDRLRHRASHEALQDPFDDEGGLCTESEAEAVGARIDVARLLDRLPPRHRLPIVHMKLEGLSVVETARLTGMSESAVKIGVHRGMKALALMLRERR